MSMKNLLNIWCGVIEFSLLTAALSVSGCGRPPVRPSNQQVTAILAKGAPFSQDFFYECVLNEYAQGIPLKQIQEDCEIKLSENDKKGFGKEDLFGPFVRNSAWFDPAKVTAACNAGDPRRAAGKDKSVVDGAGDIQFNFWDGKQVDYGRYSWGGKDQCDSNGCYQGLSEEQSEKLKTDAVRKAKEAYEDFLAAKQVAAQDPRNKAKQADAKQKEREANDAEDAAKRDPNKVDRVVVNVNRSRLGTSMRRTAAPPSPGPREEKAPAIRRSRPHERSSANACARDGAAPTVRAWRPK